ncbi:MAG: aminotransferase class III-fold pyridoxal phosphate-dependent enzyme, partial [Candidatus Kariarchaeaceae archaeon]
AAPHGFENYFFIEGGALAVENTLKSSFDWKFRKNLANGNTEVGSQVIHFKQAFHGRSGYTMSLTNTADPRKYKYFPTFKWPRVTNPKKVFPIEEHIEEVKLTEQQSISEINSAIEKAGDDIAALIIEPIQGEGGDNHFREEFLNELRTITLENEIMLIYDEIQTGIALTGKMWAFEHYPDAKPDLVAFGKKTQVCGFMSTDRVKEVENNVFEESSRINSTWGGNLVDMVRSTKILDIIKEDSIVSQVNTSGEYLMKLLYEFQETFDHLTNVRGRGLFAAFDLPTTEIRNQFKKDLFTNGLIMLPSGVSSIRFRPPLITTPEHIDEAGTILEKSLKSI